MSKENPLRWMNLPDKYRTGDSKFVILPIPYENSPTYGEGAAKGPAAIIEASQHLEYYDERLDCEPFEKGIIVEEPLLLPDEPEEAMEEIAAAVKGIVKKDVRVDEKEGEDSEEKFLISLGGDHAITIGTVKGLEESEEDFSVLILDAHADMKFSWNNSQNNHACVARRLSTKHKVGVIGVRSMDVDEAKEIEQSENVRIIKAYDYSEKELEKMLEFLGDKVCLSIDVDVFDPSIIRNTGTPEPGGLDWETINKIIATLAVRCRIVAADVVEFAPQGPERNYRAEAYALARLVYRLMALQARKK